MTITTIEHERQPEHHPEHRRASTQVRAPERDVANGATLAAFLAAGIGASAMGLVVILNELGVLAAPALYGPAGGVSGRTTLAAAIWLGAWGTLHHRWRRRRLEPRGIHALTLALILLGLLLTFPPVWGLL